METRDLLTLVEEAIDVLSSETVKIYDPDVVRDWLKLHHDLDFSWDSVALAMLFVYWLRDEEKGVF